MSPNAGTVFADWVRLGHRLEPGVRITIERGRIARIDTGARPQHGESRHALLLPAFHNAHSHAFQWAMRGATQHLDPGHPDDDFWSWRERMYAVAMRFTPDEAYAVALECYRAMVAHGYVSVGEFHYLHRQPDGALYEPMSRLAVAHVEAARDAGIRIVLIPVAYERGGVGRPLAPNQVRFDTTDADTYLRLLDAIRADATGDHVSIIPGCHSIRACSAATIRTVAALAAAERLPFHIHACEQRRELRESLEEYGAEPLLVLEQLGALGPRTTIVHGTHLAHDDLDRLQRTGTTVCACPTTERDLGDGFIEARQLLRRGIPIAIGTDSQTSVSPREELRLLEYHERLRAERRNALTVPERNLLAPRDALLPMGSLHGARSLGLDSGEIEVGRAADLVAFDTALPRVGDAETLLDAWLFCDPAPRLAAVYRDGRRIIAA